MAQHQAPAPAESEVFAIPPSGALGTLPFRGTATATVMGCSTSPLIIIIIIEGLSLLQSIPPTTANKQTQAQKKRGSMARKLLGFRVYESIE